LYNSDKKTKKKRKKENTLVFIRNDINEREKKQKTTKRKQKLDRF
jgi:hypothetical protein